MRPSKTTTDRMQSKDELKKYLKDYEQIPEEDVNFMTIGQLLRYISYDKKTRREIFRFGGLLKKIDKEYVVLQGKNGMTFSAQRYTYDDNGNKIHTTRFFKKHKPEEVIKVQYEEAIDRSNELIDKQNEVIDKQKLELKALKKRLEELEKSKSKR
jgi:hypothetical protein